VHFSVSYVLQNGACGGIFVVDGERQRRGRASGSELE
jgi:hypothetical protein